MEHECYVASKTDLIFFEAEQHHLCYTAAKYMRKKLGINCTILTVINVRYGNRPERCCYFPDTNTIVMYVYVKYGEEIDIDDYKFVLLHEIWHAICANHPEVKVATEARMGITEKIFTFFFVSWFWGMSYNQSWVEEYLAECFAFHTTRRRPVGCMRDRISINLKYRFMRLARKTMRKNADIYEKIKNGYLFD